MFKIYRFNKIGSTNNIAQKYKYNSVIVAAEQESGKGRFERRWNSPRGGLWFSIVVGPEREAFEYTFISSLSVLDSINVGKIKWPNDIVLNKKKICGILTEVICQGNKKKVIIGIGINVNNSIKVDLKDIAISLKDISGKQVNLDKLLEKVLYNFEKYNHVSSDRILSRYKKNCMLLGRQIKVKCVDKEIKGKAVDIDAYGRLILITEKGEIEVDEGEASVF